MRSKRIACVLLLCLCFAAPVRSRGQNPRPVPRSESGAPVTDEDEIRNRLSRDLAKKANLERQAALKNDTDKLFKLALELKQSVEKSNENVLSMDVVKKAEEIEKLAHSVREKMKGPN